MRVNSPIVLIIGADGLIGGTLMALLKHAGVSVLGTTRRNQNVDVSRVYLDLSKDISQWQYPKTIEVAIICAGITKLEDCRKKPENSYYINVQSVSVLAKKLLAEGVFVIYLSTNQVFDGLQPYKKIDDPLSPKTEYGKQKAEIEQQIRKTGDRFAIIRMTKVLGREIPLFSGWINSLKAGKVIQPFSDMVMAPVPISLVISVLKLIIDNRLVGIFHLSGLQDISYDGIAKIGANILKLDSNLIKPITSKKAGYLEYVPPNTTLDTVNLISLLGIEIPKVSWTIEKAFTAPQQLVGAYLHK